MQLLVCGLYQSPCRALGFAWEFDEISGLVRLGISYATSVRTDATALDATKQEAALVCIRRGGGRCKAAQEGQAAEL
jgi:hypothetical protein